MRASRSSDKRPREAHFCQLDLVINGVIALLEGPAEYPQHSVFALEAHDINAVKCGAQRRRVWGPVGPQLYAVMQGFFVDNICRQGRCGLCNVHGCFRCDQLCFKASFAHGLGRTIGCDGIHSDIYAHPF